MARRLGLKQLELELPIREGESRDAESLNKKATDVENLSRDFCVVCCGLMRISWQYSVSNDHFVWLR